jgi:hypothetical protein
MHRALKELVPSWQRESSLVTRRLTNRTTNLERNKRPGGQKWGSIFK